MNRQNVRPASTPQEIERREALRLGASAVAGLFASATTAPLAAESAVSFEQTDRTSTALNVRLEAARAQQKRAAPPIRTNGDEERYPNLVGNFSKSLPHAGPLAEVDRNAYSRFVKALKSGVAGDLDAIPLGGVIRLVNPQGAYAFGLEGADSHALPLAPPPAFASAELAAEACELYWQAVTRDVPFSRYDTDDTIARACIDLSRLDRFGGPRINGKVTPSSVFRGSTQGDVIGPYVSQFLWKEVPYGAIRLVPHVRTATPGLDYLTTWEDWLSVQQGGATVMRHAGTYRYIRSARDLAAYVQLDFTYQAFLTACLVLFGMEGTTDARRPYKGAPFDRANPYRTARSQSGFTTFSVAHALDLVARVANLALRHAWYHKWLVHRSLRPEEFGARVHLRRSQKADYPVHESLLSSPVLDLTYTRQRSYLLSQAYPEAAPCHPSYPSGHAAIAGACTTVLKAFFDESFPVDEPVVAREDGLSLEPYKGPTLTIGGELDKLASNISIGRNAAGIHWRSDSVGGLLLGEAVALDFLAEMRRCLHEPFAGFSVTCFDGKPVVV